MSNKNRTRKEQKQYINFMKDAGCLLNEIQHQFELSSYPPRTHFKTSPPHKHINTSNEDYYPEKQKRRREKREKTVSRKKIKNHEEEIKVLNYQGNYFIGNNQLHPHDLQNEIQIPQILSSYEKTSTQPSSFSSPPPGEQKKYFLFPLCLNKSNNNFYGYFGHSSIIVSEPIVEGGYYMEVDVLPPFHPHHPKGLRFDSSVRVGVCRGNYNLLTPIGGDNSYCYKSCDGTVLFENYPMEMARGESYGEGDTIGMLLEMAPPYRFMKDNSGKHGVNEGSRLRFFKNGKMQGEVKDLRQYFYNFAVSLWNWANVSINVGPEFKYPPEGEWRPVSEVAEEKWLYGDLKI